MTTRPGSAGTAGAETNVAVNAGRGGSPVAGAIGGAAIGTAGARSADVMNQYDRAMNQATLPDTPRATPGSNAPAGQATSGGNATTLAQAPTPGDPAGSSGAPRTPTEACGKRVLFAQARCLYQQCQKPEFAGHADCAKPAEPTN